MAEECKILFGSCQEILTEKLHMLQVVVLLMTEDQKQRRVRDCEEFFEMANDNENFLQSIITGDETWV